MAKVMTAKVKLQCPGGQATPAPPVGPALGQHGVNIGQFVMQFNERTKEMKGTTIPVEITIYSDRSFEFITKSPPAAVLLKQAAGVAAGSAEPHKSKVGSVTMEQVMKIADTKKDVLNARDPEHAARIIMGTARSMGIEIKG
jgi:large subunit ribosomal protein L11